MWLFTKYGFFSAVCARQGNGGHDQPVDPDRIMVRARVWAHLDALKCRFSDLLEDCETREFPNTDYPFRFFVDKTAWSQVMHDLSEEMDYDNFKREVGRFQGADGVAYGKALHKVWSVMYALQQKTAASQAKVTAAGRKNEPSHAEEVEPTKAATKSDWETEPLPEQRVKVVLGRRFSPTEMDTIRRGLIPQQQEDKWFIYWKDNALHLHRSWTGFCLYVVRFIDETEGGGRMIEAEVNRDPEQYSETDDAKDVAMISYLVDVLLLHQPAEYPSVADTPEEKAIEQWSVVGRAMLGEHPEQE